MGRLSLTDPLIHIKAGLIFITIGLCFIILPNIIFLILPNIIPTDISRSQDHYLMGGFLILMGIIQFLLALVAKVKGYNKEEYY
ncbi:MAG: hypothetical protein ACFFDN_08140 [Candidatus Hodarchaeota archaeon]